MQELIDFITIIWPIALLIGALVGVFVLGNQRGIIVERLRLINNDREYVHKLETMYSRLDDDKKELIQILARAVNFISAVDLPGTVIDAAVDETEKLLDEIVDDVPVTDK